MYMHAIIEIRLMLMRLSVGTCLCWRKINWAIRTFTLHSSPIQNLAGLNGRGGCKVDGYDEDTTLNILSQQFTVYIDRGSGYPYKNQLLV